MSKANFQCPLTETRTTDPFGEAGLTREEGSKVYRFVKNDESSTALSLGHVCCHQIANGVTYENKVKIPLTADLSSIAGVVVATAGIAAGSYGWIQIFGTNATISMIGATTGGADIAIGSYMKAANAVAHVVYNTTTNPEYGGRCIQILTTFTTTTTPAATAKAGYIRCLQ